MTCFKAILSILFLILAGLPAGAQYIYEILEYRPAPGQFINSAAGTREAAESVVGGINGLVSLGAFGGYLIFRFEHPVANDPGNPFGIDFTIFGNPAGNWSEPGIVSVMKDLNGNNLPDDTWYELAGSAYGTDRSDTGYAVTYINPGKETATDVSWEDNRGGAGFVYANATHTQPYYPAADLFPEISRSAYTLAGTRIVAEPDSSGSMLILPPVLGFGYADNQPRGVAPYTIPDNPLTGEIEGAGGDPMDISWAVDHTGTPVALDTIHFIKVHSAVNGHAGALGEVSTEISGAALVLPAAGFLQDHGTTGTGSGFTVFPNPVRSTLQIQGGEPGQMTIVSLSGQTMLEGIYSGTGTGLNVSDLPGGVYILQIRNNKSVYTVRIVKK
ncbi:MAG: T9SS type A sorting domain-containing protein [Bacteroidales bacterium]|nr:T9SS type A sorting domain-containing protein [Bacteroidales bacterium]